MTLSDVPTPGLATLVAIGVVALLCLAGPLLLQAGWARGRRWLWVSFGFGVLTFAISQLLLRIPLLTAVLPVLPEWQALLQQAVLAAFVLSFSAALFEETGRLLVMGTFFRRKHRSHADGVAFGLGHGGLEAFVLVGLNLLGFLVLGVFVRAGQWDVLAGALAPEGAAALQAQLSGLTVLGAVTAGLERVFALALQVALSVLILWGVVRDHPARAWGIAIVAHGAVNFVAVVALTVWEWPMLAVEGFLFVVAVVAVGWVVRARSLFPGKESVNES